MHKFMHIELSARIVAILNLINRMWAQVLFMSLSMCVCVCGLGWQSEGKPKLRTNLIILFAKLFDFRFDKK